jgi:hypothetical protein
MENPIGIDHILSREKSKQIVGSYPKDTFQLSFISHLLDVAVLNNIGFLCIPQIGCYGENYWPTIPLVVLELPTDNPETLQQQLPKNLYQLLFDPEDQLANQCGIEFYVIIHSPPVTTECPKFFCKNTNEANIMYHMWTFPDAELNGDYVNSTMVSMGIFAPQGIKPIHLELSDGGISFEKIQDMNVTIHDGCFSPENASFQMTDDPVCSFFALAFHGYRRVISFHAFPRALDSEDIYRTHIKNSITLKHLLDNIRLLNAGLYNRLVSILVPLSQAK